MALNKTQLVDDIKTELDQYQFKVTLPDGSEQFRKLFDFTQVLEGTPSNFNPASVLIATIIEKTVDHIVANMEINGIRTALDTRLNDVFTAGVPIIQDGGAALQTAWKITTIPPTVDQGTQNNDGTGHVL